MNTELPRIEKIKAVLPSKLSLQWRGVRKHDVVDLTGWIATGGKTLAPLKDENMFSRASVVNYGTAVGWDDGGDLAIDAAHLKLLAEEQKSFESADIQRWQTICEISNNEAADLLGVSLSTFNSYKSGSSIPKTIAMICRVTMRDPLVMHAHFRPRIQGRPRTRARVTR